MAGFVAADVAYLAAVLIAILVAKDLRPVTGLEGGQTGCVAPVGPVSDALLGPSLGLLLLASGLKATALFLV